MGTVKALYGGPTGEREVNDNCVQALEEWLEKAKSGEVFGVVVAALHCDGFSSYGINGRIGGYGLIGALDVAKAILVNEAIE